jgi:hypothetical protein
MIEKTILRILGSCTFLRSQGQNRKSSMRAYVFRFAPDSGLKSDIAGGPFCADCVEKLGR